MKALKFGIIACSVLLGIGVVGTGAAVGSLYKETSLVYEEHLEEKLNPAALENIYIDTDASVRIIETTGEPRVIFDSRESGIMITEPSYKMDVVTEGDTTYITLADHNEGGFNLSFGGERQDLVVYLPKKDINKLEVTSNRGWYQNLTYEGNNGIKDLDISRMNMNLDLEGNYGNIEINDGRGDVTIHSATPATVDFEGGFGDVNLTGSYNLVEINGKGYNAGNGQMNVQSGTPYSAKISSNQQSINLTGAINVAEVETYQGTVVIEPTNEPKRLKVDANSYNDVNILLPETIKGFNIDYAYEYNEPNLYSNFDVKHRVMDEAKQLVTYGEGGTDMIINTQGTVYIMK